MKTPLCLALLAVAVPLSAQSFTPTADSWTENRVIILAAARVDLSHLGIHTHADEILFQTGKVDVAALRADSDVRNVRLAAHCRYPTDAAALPPGLGSLAKVYGAVPTYGPIDGKPGWSLAATSGPPGRGGVRVSVPTRFANWVAGQSAAMQRRYKSARSYSLEIDWERQGNKAGG